MYGKSVALITFIYFLCLILSMPVYALTAQDYLNSGRASLFEGTLSGIRQAHDTFEQGMNDASCLDCQSHRELLFFHALSRIAMWAIRQDGQPINSAMEIAEAYGSSASSDVIREMTMTRPVYPENRYGQPIITSHEQLLQQLVSFMETTGMPELDSIIAELDRITETPDNRFRVFLTPEETSVFVDLGDPLYSHHIEVDFSDVLMLKGILYTAKGVLAAKSAYDTHVDPQDKLLEKFYENCLSIQNDLLLPHPDFMKRLPTANDPNDGKTILAQARRDILTGLNYYCDMIDYLWNENTPAGADPQEDELFSLDPSDHNVSDTIQNTLVLVSNSLKNDTPLSLNGKTNLRYQLTNESSQQLIIDITKGAFGTIENCGLSFFTNRAHNYDDLETELVDNRLTVYLEDEYDWTLGGLLTGTLSADHSSITNASFVCWGSVTVNMQNLSGQITLQSTDEQWTVDGNPILGSSPRYPDPISPRDLICDLDKWNKPLPNSLPDVTIGGILPEATQTDWIGWLDPQPFGTSNWPLLYPWQMVTVNSSQWPSFWLDEQRVFTDTTGEIDGSLSSGLDVHELYLGMNWEALYGSIMMTGPIPRNPSYYRIYFSRNPNDHEGDDSLMLGIVINGSWEARLYCRSFDNQYWQEIAYAFARMDSNEICFRLPLDNIPENLSGRYLSVESGFMNYDTGVQETADLNCTHIRIGPAGSISGSVVFQGHLGGPIFVQAYSDRADPEGSIIDSVILDAPGAFTLKDIGAGWVGYVRAFSPMFGDYHPFDMDALKAEQIREVIMNTPTIRNLTLELQPPLVLKTFYPDWTYGDINPRTNPTDYFAFDAVAGINYYIELQSGSFNGFFVLLDRNGSTELEESPWWAEPQSLNWTCPVNGRYYIKVTEEEWYPMGGNYQIRVSTGWHCPIADISGGQWEGVKDCRVDLNDFALLAGQWLSECSAPYWCSESDYDKSGQVQMLDLFFLSEAWLEIGFDTI